MDHRGGPRSRSLRPAEQRRGGGASARGGGGGGLARRRGGRYVATRRDATRRDASKCESRDLCAGAGAVTSAARRHVSRRDREIADCVVDSCLTPRVATRRSRRCVLSPCRNPGNFSYLRREPRVHPRGDARRATRAWRYARVEIFQIISQEMPRGISKHAACSCPAARIERG